MFEKVIRILSFLIFALFTLLVFANYQQNLIGDEAVYILEGDRYLHSPYSFYNNSGSPHLLKTISATLFYALPLNRDYSPYFEKTNTDVYNAARFTYDQNPHFAQAMITLARIPHLVLALALALAIYIFTKKHFGSHTALIAIVFYAFNANILANAATANLDIGTTAFCFFTLISFYSYITKKNKQSTKLLILTGILLGLAQVTKISAVLLYPFIILAAVMLKQSAKLKEIAFMFALSFLTIWAIYGFQVGPIIMPHDDPAGIEAIYGSLPVIKNSKLAITDTLRLPIFPAGAFLNNFTYQFTHTFFGHTVYFDGQFTDKGIWYFIPLAFIYKNSIVFIGSLILAAFVIIKKKRYLEPAVGYLILWTVLMLVYSMTSKLQLGTRYFLPAFPTLFILAAIGIKEGTASFLSQKAKPLAILAILATYTLSNLSVFPAFFTYTNEVLRFQSPLKYMSDSDYDWGQSVYKMEDLQRKYNLYPLFFKSYGGASQGYYKIQTTDTVENAFQTKQNGYYALSHSALIGFKKDNPPLFEYFSRRRPDHIIDRVIYVYKIDY